MIDKKSLRETMLALTGKDLEQAQHKYEQFLARARVERDEPVLRDEQAQAASAAELAEAFEDSAHDYDEKLRVLEHIDFGPKTDVQEGAVVRLDSGYLVVAVSTGAFEHDGHRFVGISTGAPIYQVLDGMRAGETAEFNGRTLHIHEVL